MGCAERNTGTLTPDEADPHLEQVAEEVMSLTVESVRGRSR